MKKRTEIKTFMIWNLDKEEKWLNQMESEGWHLIDIYNKDTYKFEECEPGKYVIRLELLEKSINKPESEKYIDFIEDTGATYISNRGNIVYFTGLAEKKFELFSDNTSRINYYSRLIKILRWLVICCWLNTINPLLHFLRNLIFLKMEDEFAWIFLLIAIIWLVLSMRVSVGLSKLIKKRKALKEEQNLFE